MKRGYDARAVARRQATKQSDDRSRRLLRSRRERPCSSRVTDKRDEFAPLHVRPSTGGTILWAQAVCIANVAHGVISGDGYCSQVGLLYLSHTTFLARVGMSRSCQCTKSLCDSCEVRLVHSLSP